MKLRYRAALSVIGGILAVLAGLAVSCLDVSAQAADISRGQSAKDSYRDTGHAYSRGYWVRRFPATVMSTTKP
jgi:hypothetical protein